MNAHTNTAPITVGVDESPESMYALRWAVREAALIGAPLELVHAIEPVIPSAEARYAPLWTDAALSSFSEPDRLHARELLAAAEDVVRETDPAIPVSTRAVTGFPYQVLTDAAEHASLMVVGSHGRGLLGRMLLGSVSTALGAKPPCPLAVVRTHTRAVPPAEGDLPVVVGVDGSAVSRAAMRYAADHAANHRARLIITHSFRTVGQAAAGTDGEQFARRTRWLQEVALEIEKDHPVLDYTCTVTADRPAQSLVEWSVAARAVFVGSGGRPAYAGSVSQALLHHAWSPVIVIPESATGGAENEQG